MRSSFKVNSENYQQVKSLIKNYKSLRHLNNPLEIRGVYYFSMEGEVEDFNEFHQELWKLENPEPVTLKPTSFWSKIKSLFHHDSNN